MEVTTTPVVSPFQFLETCPILVHDDVRQVWQLYIPGRLEPVVEFTDKTEMEVWLDSREPQ
jgi:hypothetical protein